MRILGVVFLAASLAMTGAAQASFFVSKDVAAAKAMTPTGSPFARALHEEYTALADEALKESDLVHARRYVDKALTAGGGRDVAPENPGTWLLPRRSRAWLSDSYARLLAALDGGGRETEPRASARAQAMLDCWIEEEHEDIWARAPGVDMYQPEDIERCRHGFLQAMEVLTASPAMAPAAGEPTPATRSRQPAPKPEPREFVIHFAFDSAMLDDKAVKVLDAVAALAQQDRAARISVFGHTDRAGTVAYNLGLSRRRAEAVVEALSRLGIARDRMVSSSFGETKPIVATPDGVANPQNRRAEITVQ